MRQKGNNSKKIKIINRIIESNINIWDRFSIRSMN